jgi:DNA-directed RNA polymerase subunit E'/Rpb7
MENNDIFVRSLLHDKIKILPSQLDKNVRKHILKTLQKKYEGLCSNHGYIQRGSVQIFKVSMGSVLAVSLNGYVEYRIQYYAEVCNPSVHSIIPSKIVNSNKFGFLAHTGIRENGVFTPILEIILPRNTLPSNVQFEIGDEVWCEVVGKKFELGDHRICIVGKLVERPGAAEVDVDDDGVDDGVVEGALVEDDAAEESGDESEQEEKSEEEEKEESSESIAEESDDDLDIEDDDFDDVDGDVSEGLESDRD